MEQALKKTFPKFRVFDYSIKKNDAIKTILHLCATTPDIIVYIKKNENNSDYFHFLDQMDSLKQFNDPKPLEEIIINSDNYFGFKESIPLLTKMRHIRKNLIDNQSCIVCFCEQTEILRFNNCVECTSPTCMECLSKYCIKNIEDGKASKDSDGNLNFECMICKHTFIMSV